MGGDPRGWGPGPAKSHSNFSSGKDTGVSIPQLFTQKNKYIFSTAQMVLPVPKLNKNL